MSQLYSSITLSFVFFFNKMTSRNGLSTDVRRLIIEYQRVNGGGSTEYDRKIVYRVECSGCYSVLSDRCMRVN